MLGIMLEWAFEVLAIFVLTGTTFYAVLSASSVLSLVSFPSFNEEGLFATALVFFVFEPLLLDV